MTKIALNAIAFAPKAIFENEYSSILFIFD